jgi:hypothetical protein
MAPLIAAKGAGVSDTRRGKTEAAISRALLPIVRRFIQKALI